MCEEWGLLTIFGTLNKLQDYLEEAVTIFCGHRACSVLFGQLCVGGSLPLNPLPKPFLLLQSLGFLYGCKYLPRISQWLCFDCSPTGTQQPRSLFEGVVPKNKCTSTAMRELTSVRTILSHVWKVGGDIFCISECLCYWLFQNPCKSGMSQNKQNCREIRGFFFSGKGQEADLGMGMYCLQYRSNICLYNGLPMWCLWVHMCPQRPTMVFPGILSPQLN